MTQSASAPMILSVARQHDCIGFLRSAVVRGFQAYDAVGQLVGLFQDKQAAAEAITAASTQFD